jgi:hypothetical protein
MAASRLIFAIGLCAAAHGQVILEAPRLEAAARSELSVPVTVSAPDGLGAAHIEVQFDPSVLEALAVEKGPVLGNALLDFKVAEAGLVVAGFASMDPINTGGVLLNLRFRVRGDARGSSPLHLVKLSAWRAEDRSVQQIQATHGQVAVTGGPAAGKPRDWLLPLLVALGVAALALLIWLLLKKRKKPTVRCPNPACQAPLRPGAAFCDRCGRGTAPLASVFCPNPA